MGYPAAPAEIFDPLGGVVGRNRQVDLLDPRGEEGEARGRNRRGGSSSEKGSRSTASPPQESITKSTHDQEAAEVTDEQKSRRGKREIAAEDTPTTEPGERLRGHSRRS